MNFYRNKSHIIKARLEVEKAVAQQRATSILVSLEVKQQKVLTDSVLKQIGILQMKKTYLQSNTSTLGTLKTLQFLDLSCLNIYNLPRKRDFK